MNFRLQLLHASDMEGGGGDLLNAPNFVAIVDHLEDQQANTLFISSGDLVLPGPYLSAAADASIQPALQSAAEQLYGLPAGSLSGLQAASGRVETLLMDLLDASAVTLGNHEFDLGTGLLAGMVAPVVSGTTLADIQWVGSQFPYLSANLDLSGDRTLAPLATTGIVSSASLVTTPQSLLEGAAPSRFAPVVVSEVGGEQIGIIGLTTQILASISSPGGVKVVGEGRNDMRALADLLQPLIDQLEAQGVNKIILASHLQQIQFEEELAGLLRGVDIIMAGGSNALLANEKDQADGLFPGAAQPYKAYPILTRDAAGNDVAIVNTDGGWRYVGELNVEFDAAGKLLAGSISQASAGVYASTDAQVAALWGSTEAAFVEGTKGAIARDLVDAVAGFVATQDGSVLGLSSVYLVGERGAVRSEETNLGNLTADANLWYARQTDASVMVSIKNGGGIREPIGRVVIEGADGLIDKQAPGANPAIGKPEGGISQLDIASSLRFNNDLSVISVTRATLVEVLEHAVAATGPSLTPGAFAQVSGIRYSFDWSQPAGARIQNAAIVDEAGNTLDVLVANARLVGDAAAEVRMVTLGFLADGGDGYPLGEGRYSQRVDLQTALDGRSGQSTFAVDGSEQDAFAEYLLAQYAEQPYEVAETPASEDMRIQNLALRDDQVLKAPVDPLLRLYDAAFNRGADGTGLGYWLDQRSELSLLQVAESFLASAEFAALQVPVGSEAFIDLLYANRLQRSADEAGKAYWLGELQEGKSAALVLLGISESAESLALAP